MNGPLPTFLGIGAPKAATTWLFRCLEEHPEVYMAPCKETNFFDWQTDRLEDRLDEYRAHFRGADPGQAIGEFSVRYLASRRAPERIARMLPDVRLIVSLRDPVEQVQSHFWHLRRQNFHRGRPSEAPRKLEEALERCPGLLLEPARYARHLSRWLRCFDRSSLLVLLYDDVREDPRGVLRRTYGFVGVDDAFTPPSVAARDLSARVGTSPRSEALGRLESHAVDLLSRYAYQPLKRLVGVRRAIRLKESLRLREILLRVFERPGYPPLSEATEDRLRRMFHEEVRFLEPIVGRSLERWMEPSRARGSGSGTASTGGSR